MAGRPKLRAVVAALLARARRAGLDEVEPGADPLTEAELAMSYVLYWMRGGDARPNTTPTMSSLARELEVSRALLYEWVTGTEERKRLLILARKESASTHVEDAIDILDLADPLEGARANSRAQFRKWLASVYSREEYGQAPAGPLVAINLGSLHLQAHDLIKALPSQGSVPAMLQPGTDEEVAQVLGYE